MIGGTIAIAGIIALAGIVYILFGWRRSPRAYRAMLALAGVFFVAGGLAGGWLVHALNSAPIVSASTPLPAAAPSVADAPPEPVSVSGPISATLTGIEDGDTIYVHESNGSQATIRLAGIDAPEKAQPYGPEATANLRRLLAGGAVNLICTGEVSYGRQVCKILLPDGEDVCLDQIKAGLAWHYKQYEETQPPAERAEYATAEDAARHAHLRLWSDPHPTAPWDFRHDEQTQLCFDKSDDRIQCTANYAGPVRGNERTHIYVWPECPYSDAIGESNRVEFANAQEAQEAGYRPAHNCP
jgi:endonuclease YncB( thermonuclease family)